MRAASAFAMNQQDKDRIIQIIRRDNGGKETRFEVMNRHIPWWPYFVIIGVVLFFMLLNIVGKWAARSGWL